MVYDPQSAPPNISQLEAHDGDADEATKEQVNEDADKLNEAVRQAQKEAQEEQLKLKQERLDNTDAVGDTRREFRREGGPEDTAEQKAQEETDAGQHPAPTAAEETEARRVKLGGPTTAKSSK